MKDRISDADAGRLAAAAGVALDGEAAHNAAVSMARPLAAADGHARALAFEAEPSTFAAVQRRCKP